MKPIKFIVKAGRHYSNNFFRFRLSFRSKIEVQYSISEAAHYNYNNVINGCSKIIGLSDWGPHLNSCRIAFINSNAGLKICFYVYSNGFRQIVNVTDIHPGEVNSVKIERARRKYIVTHTNSRGAFISYFDMPPRYLPWQFILHPYVGGLFTLDHDLTVLIQK